MQADETPPVMWPEEGSGFEADPFSPAGTEQRRWLLLGQAANLGSNRRALKVLGLAVGFVAAVILISMGISALSH
ncbi:MAG TPA: hypothetical protein VIE15_02815 [Acidimicrobiales bacterium]